MNRRHTRRTGTDGGCSACAACSSCTTKCASTTSEALQASPSSYIFQGPLPVVCTRHVPLPERGLISSALMNVSAAGYWAVDAKEETAMNGTWKKGPGTELFAALERVGCFFVSCTH